MRHYRFVVHLDVRRYFPNIDLDILRGRLRRRIRDRAFLAVIDLVLESGAGLLDQPGVRACLGVPSDWPERGLPVGVTFAGWATPRSIFCFRSHSCTTRSGWPRSWW